MSSQQVQIDPKATMMNGATAVSFSRAVGASTAIGLGTGSEVVFPSDPSNVYAVASVASDGMSCVLSAPFAGPDGVTPCWFYNVSIPGMMRLGSAPLTTGATSIALKADASVTSDGPMELLFASQPYQLSLVFAIPYVTTAPLSTTEGSTTVVSFSPAYGGPTTAGSVNVGLVGING